MTRRQLGGAAARQWRRGAPAWVLALAASTMLTFTGCGSEEQGDPLARAEVSFSKGDYQAATVQLKSLLIKDPKSAQARYLLGKVLMEQGQAAGALTEFEKALEIGLGDEGLRGSHAKALLANGRYQELLKQYDKPQFQDARVQSDVLTALAVAHLRFGRTAQAQQALEAAIKTDPKAGWAYVTKARMTALGGDIDGAQRLLQQAIDSGRAQGEAWYLRGVILQRLRDDAAGAEAAFKEAVKDRRYAREADQALVGLYVSQGRVAELKAMYAAVPKTALESPPAMLLGARIAYLEGRYGNAREALDKLQKLAPNNQDLLVLSGAVDLRRGAWLRAESELGRAVQMSEDAQAPRQLLAETYLQMGQPEKALGVLRPLLASGNAPPATLARAGDANLQLGQYEQAAALFEAALRRRPDDPALKTAVALSGLARGQTGEAVAALERIAASDRGDVADKALIGAHMRRHEYPAALAALDRLDKKAPGKLDVQYHRGLILAAQGDGAGARGVYEGILKAQPLHYGAAVSLARLDADDGQFDKARERLRALVAAHPASAAARLTLADFLTKQGGDPAEVKRVLSEGVAALPNDAALRVALVTHLLLRRDAQAALTVAQQAEATFRDQPDVLDALGRAQADSGDVQQAITTFGRIVGLQPNNPLPLVRLADVYARKRDLAAAARSLKRAAEVAPEATEVYERVLALGRKSRDIAPALALAKDIQRARPGSAHGYVLEGDLFAERREWPAALAAFRTGLGKADPQSRAAIRVFEALRTSGQEAAARAFVAEHRRAKPDDAHFAEYVAVTDIRSGRLADAQRLLEAAVAIRPDSATAWNNLAWVRAERGATDALPAAERALALAPRSAAVLDTVAKVLAANGQMPRALDLQRQALAISRQAPDYRLHLAQLLELAGDKPAARVELDALAALGKDYPGQAAVAELRTRLDRK